MNLDSTPNLYVGTSSWSAESWVGPFYPPGTPPADFLPIYVSHFQTVEIDSTYYRIPSRKMVQAWFDRTPAGFIFAAKFPQDVTHKKVIITAKFPTGCSGAMPSFPRATPMAMIGLPAMSI